MENSLPHIIQYCHVKNSSIYVDGKSIYHFDTDNFEVFADNAYKNLDLKYPKFHKMDNLSKLGFLCAEMLLKDLNISNYEPQQIAINIVNKNSSIDTDIRYNNLIAKGTSSPAIFVYSLPNIMMGEICIKHHIQGDNLLFVSDHYDTKLQYNYMSSLFENKYCEVSIGGWIDYIENSYEAFLFLIEKKNNTTALPFTIDNINQLYKTISK